MMSRRSVVRDWSKEVEVNEERMEASGSTTSESRTRQGSENKKGRVRNDLYLGQTIE